MNRQELEKFYGKSYEFKEIFRLKEMLEAAEIPFEFREEFGGYQIIINNKISGKRMVDAIEHFGSYGKERDLLEIMGGLTKKEYKYDSVLGYLTAEEVFKRFKYCYEHNTHVYHEEETNEETISTN